eukprot:gene11658-8041_t
MSGLYVFLTVLFFALTLPVCLLVYRYFTRVSIKTIPFHCAVWHVIALYTCAVAFPLLVVDVNAAFNAPSPQTWMQPIWMTIFGMSYFCAWISLPIAQMYTEVGEFQWKRAVWHSVKLNVKLYAVIVTLILVLLGYLVILKGAYTSLASTGKVVISLANSWGLLMLILFMPAGLIGIPRMLWRYSDPSRELCRKLFDAVDLQEDLDLAAMDLCKLKTEIIQIDPLVSDENREHLASMLEAIYQAEADIPMYRAAAQRVRVTAVRTDTSDVSLQHLEDLNAKLKKAIKIATRVNYRWFALVHECDVLDRLSRGVVEASEPAWLQKWHQYRRPVYLAGCGACSVLTGIILWSEVTLPFRVLTTYPLGLIEVLMNQRACQFVTSVIFLFYMAYCSFWAAFQFKVFNVYVIYPRIADNASLCFNEVFLVRLLMPLCFNFLLMSGLATSGEDVQYGHVYRRNMDISLLFGEWVNQFLPIVIPVVAAVVLFKLAGRVMELLGIEIYNPDDLLKPSVQQRIQDGKRLVEIERGRPLGDIRTEDGQDIVIVDPEQAAPRGGESGAGAGSGSGAGSGGGPPSSAAASRGARYREYLAKKRAAELGGDAEREKADDGGGADV